MPGNIRKYARKVKIVLSPCRSQDIRSIVTMNGRRWREGYGPSTGRTEYFLEIDERRPARNDSVTRCACEFFLHSDIDYDRSRLNICIYIYRRTPIVFM